MLAFIRPYRVCFLHGCVWRNVKKAGYLGVLFAFDIINGQTAGHKELYPNAKQRKPAWVADRFGQLKRLSHKNTVGGNAATVSDLLQCAQLCSAVKRNEQPSKTCHKNGDPKPKRCHDPPHKICKTNEKLHNALPVRKIDLLAGNGDAFENALDQIFPKIPAVI